MSRNTSFFLKSIFIISAAIFFYSSNASSAAKLHFKNKNFLGVCSYSEFKPISYGNGQGYEADLIRAIAKFWGVDVKFYPRQIFEGIWLLSSGRNSSCDIAIGGLTPAGYRKKQGARFTVGTMSFDQSLLVRRKDYESGRITSYRSFKNTKMKIGVVPGTTGEQFALVRAGKNGLPPTVLVQYESESQLLPALLSGQIDAIARGSIGNEFQASLNKNLITIARKNFREHFAFSVDPSNKALLEAFNRAIPTITDHNRIGYKQWSANHDVFSERAGTLLSESREDVGK